MRLHKIILIVISFITAAMFVTVVLLAFSPFIKEYWHRTEFDREVWVNWEETETTMFVKGDMVHDLLNKYEFKGLTADEVTEFLGQPDQQSEFHISYNLGPAREMGISYGSLWFELKDGKVVEYGVHKG